MSGANTLASVLLTRTDRNSTSPAPRNRISDVVAAVVGLLDLGDDDLPRRNAQSMG